MRDGVPRASKLVNTSGVTRMEIGKFLENFKTDILGTLTSQFNALKTKKRKEEEDHATLHIFFHKCGKRHPLKECHLNTISICAVCTEKDRTRMFSALPEIQALYKIGNEPVEQSYASIRP